MHLSLPTLRWDPRLAQISDLKAAYLLAFARFGYWYAFDSALDIVRRQITVSVQKALASGFALRPTGEPVKKPQMLLMRSPIDALLVWVRRTPYLLPGLSMRADFYDTAQQVFGGDQPMTVTGQPVDFPQWLPMELDFADDSRGT
jgi:hypothetical protein